MALSGWKSRGIFSGVSMNKLLVSGLLAGTALVALNAPSLAQPRRAAPPSDPRIGVLEQQLRDVQLQLAQIKQRQDDSDPAAALSDLKRSASDQYADINSQIAGLPRSNLNNGRFTVTSADGAFSLSLRGLVQFDTGYFAQGRNPPNVDLNSGSNFRRAQLGFQGTAWRDWSYNFVYDFGGNGVEGRGYIYTAYIQYDGLKPFGFRIGAYTPAAGIEDQTGSADLIFLERPASVDVGRNIAGAPGREAASIYAQGDNYLVSLSYTGKRTTDGTSTGASVGTFDSQQALVGRASYLAINNSDVKWLLDGHVTHVLKLADTVASTGPSTTAIRLSNGPELAVDASRTVDTGSIDAKRATEFGFETAFAYDALYTQGGWYHYDVERRTALPNPDFSGWYALATWSLTGEQHAYDPATASFRQLRPSKPLGTPGGFGALEVKARYSSIDLDYQPLLAAASGGVAGGQQNVWTVGLNWYPTQGIRFALDYDNIQVNHINAPATDISANAIGLRAQISL
jgi:phosphate-selective porin OprO/OprP